MARIIYGVCGEGSGHSSRAKEILTHLKKKGHKVKVVGYGRSLVLKKYFKVTDIEGLHMVFEKNRLRHRKTLLENIKNVENHYSSFLRVNKLFKKFKPDIAFTDFEPLTGFIANLHGVPLISIDNQHRLTHMKLRYPKKYEKEAMVAKLVTSAMVAHAKAYLVTTFFFEKVHNDKTFLFPPILRSEVLRLKPAVKGHILVYQTSQSNTKILDVLKQVDSNFIVYGFNVDKKDKNLRFKKFSLRGFLNDLKDAKAVISSGGFTLMTESIYLGKPFLAEPLHGQFEQTLNSVYLQRLGYGKFESELSKRNVERFIHNIPKYRKNLRCFKQKDNNEIFGKVDELILRRRNTPTFMLRN